jgi:hypothetical protein
MEERHGIQVFASPSDAPRVRWRTDLMSAGFTTALLAFLIFVAGEGSTLDDNTLTFIGTLPGWLLWLAQAAYLVGVLHALGLLIGVGLFARGRLELLRDMNLAAALAVVFVLALTQFIDNRWPELAFFDLQQTRDTFPAFFVTTSVAIQAAASPNLTAPMRKLGWAHPLRRRRIGDRWSDDRQRCPRRAARRAHRRGDHPLRLRDDGGASVDEPGPRRDSPTSASRWPNFATPTTSPRHRSSWSARRPTGPR